MVGPLTIQRLLLRMKELAASDLHIKIGSPPIMRVASKLHHVNTPPLAAADTEQLLSPIIPESLRPLMDTQGGADFSHHEDAGERFRCSVFKAGGGLHAAIRRVNPQIPDFESLHLPPVGFRAYSPSRYRRISQRVRRCNHLLDELESSLIPDAVIQAAKQLFVLCGNRHGTLPHGEAHGLRNPGPLSHSRALGAYHRYFPHPRLGLPDFVRAYSQSAPLAIPRPALCLFCGAAQKKGRVNHAALQSI